LGGPSKSLLRWLAVNAAVVAGYVAAAAVGFRFAFVAEQITTVWAPTGIAVAALLLAGIRVWPAVWIGALLANAGSNAPLWTAFAIASGNTLEAVTAVWLLRRRPRFEVKFQRVTDVVTFVCIGALACTAISATIGVGTLVLAGVQPWGRVPALWFDWWLGDALGAAVVAPAILTAVSDRWSRRDGAQTAAWVGTTLVVTHLVFGQVLGATPHPLEFAVFPLVIGAAVLGGPRVTALVVLAASGLTIWHTVHGSGPFASPQLHYSLILLQVFMGVLAGTSLVLAAAIAERLFTHRQEKEAAEGLRRREEMLRLAQQAGGVATFEWDFRNQRAQCSGEFFRIFGLPARDGVMAGADWGHYVHPDDRGRMAVHLAQALAGTEAAAADYRINAADGQMRWLSYAGKIERTEIGDRLLGTVVDITDRKRLEDELRHHADEVERILESIGEGFIALDRDFRYVYVNGAAERMLDTPRAEMLGRRPWEVFPAEIISAARRHIEAAMQSGTAAQHDIHIAGWGRWFENRLYPSATGLSIFFADVTARREAEQALRESRDVLSLAMRAGAMGAWSRNLITNEVWWSPELEEIFGLPSGAFDRSEAGFFEFVHEQDRGAVVKAVEAAVRTGSDYIVEFRFQHASGEWRWMEGRGRATGTADGSARTLYGIGIDVTERKRDELALREAKSAAESANQLKDHFLATLSHELRTPLNAILGYARMLQTNAIAPDKRPQAIEVIERNAVAQNRLVEDLLDMSRITTGKVRLDPQPVPVVTVLREAVEGVKPAADGKGIAVTLDLDPFAGTVKADTTRLQQIFWNLLMNAVKFTSGGGRITVTLRRQDAHVEIAVTDTGSGIAADFLPFVFEPFRQAEGCFDRTHGGLGLGLAISRQLVELHGGTVAAASPGVGLGATFTVRLPRVDVPGLEPVAERPPASIGAAAAAAQAPSILGLSILLVDDEEDTLVMFRDALEHAGARVRAVATAADALREMENNPPDLLVTDLGLSGVDGYELLRTIRARHPHRMCAAVAVSAYARLDDRSRALAAGFDAHVAKPIDPAALVDVLRSALAADQ
jgi:PAS domain S-box-containing protein